MISSREVSWRGFLERSPREVSWRGLLESSTGEVSCRCLLWMSPREVSCRSLLERSPIRVSWRRLLDVDYSKKIFFKVSESNAEAWGEDTTKKMNEKNGSVGTVSMQELTKEVNSALQGIQATINGNKPSKPQKK